jgi:hypothetical protein
MEVQCKSFGFANACRVVVSVSGKSPEKIMYSEYLFAMDHHHKIGYWDFAIGKTKKQRHCLNCGNG